MSNLEYTDGDTCRTSPDDRMSDDMIRIAARLCALCPIEDGLKESPLHDLEVGIESLIAQKECITDRAERALASEILEERDRQNEQWGGAEHDDEHDEFDWPRFCDKFLVRAATAGWYICNSRDTPRQREIFESNMLKIAALAVAAIQSSRRKRK